MRTKAKQYSLLDFGGWFLLALLLAAYAVVAFSNLTGVSFDADEGIAVSEARLMVDGYSLYDPIWTDHTPGHPVLVSLAFRLFGPTIAAARGVTVLFGLVAIFAVVWAARGLLLERRAAPGVAWAGALAGGLAVAVAPNFWWASRAAMMGIPTFSLAALSVAFMISYARTGRATWLAAAALAMGLSLWIKIQMFYLLPLFPLLVLWARRGWHRAAWRTVVRDLAILVAGVAAPLAISLIVYNPRVLWDQVVGTYLATRNTFHLNLEDNLETFTRWLSSDNLGLVALALAGVLVLLARPSASGFLVLAWCALAAGTAVQHPLLEPRHHFLPLLLAMGVLAGTAVGYGLLLVGGLLSRKNTEGYRVAIGAAVVLAAAVYAVRLPAALNVDANLRVAQPYDNNGAPRELDESTVASLTNGTRRTRQTIEAFRQNTTRDDFVFTDELMLAFLADRRMPPEAAALSDRRRDIGMLTDEDLIRMTERYKPRVIVPYRKHLIRRDAYMEWLGQHYVVARTLDRETDVYVPKDTP